VMNTESVLEELREEKNFMMKKLVKLA
jgi:hypothetical protein